MNSANDPHSTWCIMAAHDAGQITGFAVVPWDAANQHPWWAGEPAPDGMIVATLSMLEPEARALADRLWHALSSGQPVYLTGAAPDGGVDLESLWRD